MKPVQDMFEEENRPFTLILHATLHQDIDVNKMAAQARHHPPSIAPEMQSLQMEQAPNLSSGQGTTGRLEPLAKSGDPPGTKLLLLTELSSATSSSPTTLATTLPPPPKRFTLFPKFPFELRQMIWREVLVMPQVLSFDHSLRFGLTPMQEIEMSKKYEGQLESWSTLVTVSKEARTESLKVRKPLQFLTRRKPGYDTNVKQKRTLCWNGELDIVWYSDHNILRFVQFGIPLVTKSTPPNLFPKLAFSLDTWHQALLGDARSLLGRLRRYDYLADA
ncbi:hypothetical protein ONS95_001302 [Cadophora gregata]|uniref:uncharacterized protein n=1 Tax=Cadophora gregata TaxID=51156 RepID=UPI0026DC59CB|nr:uncharacterized protein ONS95_001302 [Cadophora gregata]KAK0129376.1 hypothetical protein ONS95_001302 [Cadophora gregata]